MFIFRSKKIDNWYVEKLYLSQKIVWFENKKSRSTIWEALVEMMRHHTGSLNNTTRNLSEQQHFSALSLFRIVFVDISQIQFIYYKIPAIYEDILLNTKLRVFAIVVVVIILVFKGACLIKKRRLQCSSLFLKGAGDHHRFSLYLEKNLKMIMCHWAV